MNATLTPSSAPRQKHCGSILADASRREKKTLDPGTSSRGENFPMRAEPDPEKLLRSGALARLAGVSPDTLRFYDRANLIQPPTRSSGRYRLYRANAFPRVRLIRGALALGFRVSELAEIFRTPDSGAAPCPRVRTLVAGRLQGLDYRLSELPSFRKLLAAVIPNWDKLLKKAASRKRAELLDAFIATHPEAGEIFSPQLRPGLRQRLAKKEKQR
jgi:DNA-binding transcriptional MerR regulator